MKAICNFFLIVKHGAPRCTCACADAQLPQYYTVSLELQNNSAFRTVDCCLAGSDIGEADRKSQKTADPKTVSALTIVLFPLAASAYHTLPILCSSCLSTV